MWLKSTCILNCTRASKWWRCLFRITSLPFSRWPRCMILRMGLESRFPRSVSILSLWCWRRSMGDRLPSIFWGFMATSILRQLTLSHCTPPRKTKFRSWWFNWGFLPKISGMLTQILLLHFMTCLNYEHSTFKTMDRNLKN